MKKYLGDSRFYLIIGLILFLIGTVDTVSNDANSYSQMTWWGKSCIVVFTTILLGLFIKSMLIPITYLIFKRIKSKFNK